jgi:hypothetical protein
MIEKDVLIFLTLLISALASWVIYLLFRVMDLKEDVRVARGMSEYYKNRLTTYESMAFKIKENLKDVG